MSTSQVSGIEGNFRTTCESVMRVLRSNKESVTAMLEAFVHDPLINWRLLNANDATTTTEILRPPQAGPGGATGGAGGAAGGVDGGEAGQGAGTCGAGVQNTGLCLSQYRACSMHHW
jgi:FKBP12-rapamycin complex-associated protein